MVARLHRRPRERSAQSDVRRHDGPIHVVRRRIEGCLFAIVDLYRSRHVVPCRRPGYGADHEPQITGALANR